MSRFLTQKNDGTYLDEIESVEVCRWRINDICCNVECEWLADYPYPREICYSENKNKCKYFEEEKNGKTNKKQAIGSIKNRSKLHNEK